MNVIGDFITALETVVEPDEIEEVKKELLRGANKLDRGTFQDLHVSDSIFGASPKGTNLGFHHGRAHQVIAETIEGVILDLRDFRDGVVKAEAMLTAADHGAQGDLAQRQAAVEALEDANRWFDGDHRYDVGRNEQGRGGDRG